MGNALLLTERDVRAVLPMPDLIDAMAGALAQFSAGAVSQPVRTVIEVGANHAYFGIMPAALDDPPAVGAKLVTVYERNREIGLTSHLATIVLLDHDTGALAAVMDGRYITEARTAAVSAVSVKHLALPDARVLAIIGTGVQARSHLEAIRQVRALTDVRVWSPTASNRDRFAADMGATGLPVRGAATARAALAGADIVVLATSSRTPVLADADVADGAHIAAVGACRRISARCRRRWSHGRVFSWTRGPPRARRPATSLFPCGMARSARTISPANWGTWCLAAWLDGRIGNRSRSSSRSAWRSRTWSRRIWR